MAIDSVIVTDQRKIADHLNAYFQSVFSGSSVYVLNGRVFDPCEVSFVSYSGVFSMLLNLNSKKSCGPDNLPNMFLRRYAEHVVKFLHEIFRVSLLSSKLPCDWKAARISPVFKKGDRLSPQNYRPISLTSPCCKLLEHIIATQIGNFLTQHSILTNFQHGFRKGYSTVTQLVTIIHSFALNLDNNRQTDIIFLDFSKAFDSVTHDKLILKLKRIGLPEILVNWIADYLNNHEQFVAINDQRSQSLLVTSGVPQGSVLGPLLFLLYINDIVNVITPSVQIRLFADDCVLFRDINSLDDQNELNSNLHNIHLWCNEWGMILNAEKSVCMRLTRKKVPLNNTYQLGSSTLREVTSYKYLGLTITSNLSWNMHVDNICSAAFRKLGFLRHKLRTCPANVKLLSYYSFIRPKLEYASIVWDPYTKLNINKLERVQRKAVRFIYSKYLPSDSPSALMSANDIQTLESRRREQRLDFLQLLLNQKLAIDSSPYLSFLSTRNTRHHHPNLLTPFLREPMPLCILFSANSVGLEQVMRTSFIVTYV
uniref:Putative endonuclease/reverse transcriptase n=1 Tax=Rhipicephalus microplus TaxID=6941 RepID=A0A6G5AA70_RHIMP